MLIIVEGPPSSGKSILAHDLCREIGTPHMWGGHQIAMTTTNDYVSAFAERLDDYDPASGHHVVADEWHLAQYLCTRVFRTPAGFHIPESVHRYVELRLARLGAVMVQMDTHPDTLAMRMDACNPLLRPNIRIRNHITELHAVYDSYFHETALPVVKSSAGIPEILKVAEYTAKGQIPLSDYPSYLGPEAPDLLYVEYTAGTMDTLFPAYNSGQRFFWQCVPQEHLATAGFVNRWSMSPEKFDRLHEMLGRPHIVALGVEAEQHIADHAGYSVVLHPGSARRLWSKYQEEYGALLIRASLGQVFATRWTPVDELTGKDDKRPNGTAG